MESFLTNNIDNVLFIAVLAIMLGIPIGGVVWLVGRKQNRQIKKVLRIIGTGLFIGFFILVYTAEDIETEGIEGIEIEQSAHASYCDSPYTISLGFLDSGYNLSKSDAKDYILKAEKMWEDGTGLNLLTYIESASSSDIIVDFIYDERQKKVQETKQYERIRIQYEADLSNLDKKVILHNSTVENHDLLLVQYERMVAEWNNDPRHLQTQERYEELGRFKVLLDTNADQINASLTNLNNEEQALKAREKILNSMYENLGGGVEEEHFIGFFDGGRVISIYQYSSNKEVINILAHEIGHALGLEHIDDVKSTMHATSSPDQLLTKQNLETVRAFCGL